METALQTMNINNHDLFLKEVNGQMVVTFRDIDEVHERLEGTARKRFNENKEHFLEGEDYYRLSPSEIRTQNIMCIDKRQTQDIVFLTEFGYLMLVKSLTDKLAWQVQRQLVNGYFRAKSSASPPLQSDPANCTILNHTLQILQTAQKNLTDCSIGQGYVIQEHEERISSHDESLTEIEASLNNDYIPAYRWDEIQEAFLNLDYQIEELRKNQHVPNAPTKGGVPQGRQLLHSIIQPLAEKYNDGSMGYNATYRKVYVQMDVNWKYRITRFANQHEGMKKPNKIDLVSADDKLFELFKKTVVKMLQEI